jgi:hypothetical protein
MEINGNFYQGIFGELYQRFRVTSYTEIPQEQHPAVLPEELDALAQLDSQSLLAFVGTLNSRISKTGDSNSIQ